MNEPKPTTHRKRGVVGVIFRDQRLLIIRRSMTVAAPGKLCLPGGGIELGESESEALVREMQEELAIDVQPVHLCWRSVTPWGTNLAWWLALLDPCVMISRNERDLSIRKKSSRERSRPGTPYPAREVSMTVVNRSSTTVDDVSPWPQADRVNPTQGELAEERNLRSNRQIWRKLSDVS